MLSITPFNEPLIKENRYMRWFFLVPTATLLPNEGFIKNPQHSYLVGAARVAFIDGNQGTMSRVLSIEVPRRV